MMAQMTPLRRRVLDGPMTGEAFLAGDAMGRAARTRHHRRGDNRRSAPCHSRMT